MSQKYFQRLNYSMANEDTTLEYRLAESLRVQHVLTVGGSGSRSLPFLALSPQTLRIVDVSADQLLLIQLKLATIRQLEREDAIDFWTGEDQQKRLRSFQQLKVNETLRDFFEFHHLRERGAPLYWGHWEKTFQTFSKLTGLLFSKKVREGLFDAQDPYTYYQRHIKGWKWFLLLNLVGNKAMFNSLLYKGDFIQKNSPLSYYDYYFQAFERLFKLDVRRSHFLQLCFTGKVLHREALPIEFSASIFDGIKASSTQPIYEQGSIFERKEETKYDLISLSDVPSYLGGELEKTFLQKLAAHTASGGIIVNRYYLRVSEGTDLGGFEDITPEYSRLTEQELVQMYQVQLLRRSPDVP